MPSAFETDCVQAQLPLWELFRETAVYRPSSGSARTVYGIRTEMADRDRDYSTEVRVTEEVRWWACKRSDATGGIEAPVVGDTLLWPDDPVTAPWTFSGNVRRQTEDSWELEFVRMSQTRVSQST